MPHTLLLLRLMGVVSEECHPVIARTDGIATAAGALARSARLGGANS